MYSILHVCSCMCINMPTVSEQVRQLLASLKRKNETAKSQKKQFNGKVLCVSVHLCVIY